MLLMWKIIVSLEVLGIPGEDFMFLVFPFLSHWEEPKFNTVREALEFFRQISIVSNILSLVS